MRETKSSSSSHPGHERGLVYHFKCRIDIWQYIIASAYATIYAMQGRLAYCLENGERDNKIE